MNFDWTPTRIDTLRRRVAEGASTATIAGELGCSKNAVIGKTDRLGLRDDRPRRVRVAAGKPVLDAPLIDDVLAMDAGEGVPVHRLRLCHCRWVENVAPPWVFCGKTATRGSYCAEHAGRVYVSLKRKG